MKSAGDHLQPDYPACRDAAATITLTFPLWSWDPLLDFCVCLCVCFIVI